MGAGWRPLLCGVLGLCACAGPATVGPVVVRGGVIVDGGAEGRPIGEGRRFVATEAEPGTTLSVGGKAVVVPERPACVGLASVDLGDVRPWIAMGGEPPDTALAFDPSGERLAIGTWDGEVRVVDSWTGEALAERSMAETLVKRVAWSADGRTLYAAEQSPDAALVALDGTTLEERGRIALADHVERSAPPDGADLYGVYTLPAAYHLEVLDGGDLLVVATHGWNDADGVRQNRARVLRLAPDLSLRAAWPAEGAADAVILSAATGGDRVAVSLSRSATGPAPEGLPIDGVQVLALDGLMPVGGVVLPPVKPWFDRSFVWEALALGPDGSLSVGLGDGRLAWWEPGAEPDVEPLGAPVELGDLAIVASVGHLDRAGDRIYAVTAGTNIPFGAASPELRPPQPHPNENALFALDHTAAGWKRVWTWRGPHALEGLTVSEQAGLMVVGAGDRGTDTRTDLFGALVFELAGGDPTFCPTAGPVFFRHAVAPDGRIAVAEHPWREGDAVRGAYRVTVLR